MIKNCWYVAASPAELASGKIVTRTILNTPVALYRFENGRIGAAYDRCPHRFAPLSLGRVMGNTVRCGYHGACYDEAGACVEVPGQARPPKGVRLETYPVQEKHGFVWIWMGDPRHADESPAGGLFEPADDPRWRTSNGAFLSLKASFPLVIDNLFDLTHGEYVHPGSFGGSDELLYRAMTPGQGFEDGKMTYDVAERGVVVRCRSRSVRNQVGPTFHAMVAIGLGRERYDGELDRELEIRWVAPSFVAFRVTVNPSADPEARFTGLNMHAVTPESEATSHYFYRALWDFGPTHPEFAAGYGQRIHDAFEQDRQVFELQQLRIGERDLFDQHPVSFAGDAVQIRARRIIKELQSAESTQNSAAPG